MKKLFFIIFLFLLIIPFKTYAIDIIDGDLIRAAGTLDVYIVKLIPSTSLDSELDSRSLGQVAEKFKRLILNPEIFNQYGHLKWENIKDVSQSIVDEYTVSDLVRAVGDEKVYKLYPNGDSGEKRWIKAASDFTGFGYDWDAIYAINNFERDFYNLGEDLVFQTTPTTPTIPTPPAPRTNNITISVPADYSTISAALNAAIDGDTISIKPGIYNENITINKNIMLIGDSISSTIIDGQGTDNAITISAGKNILIRNLTIKSADKYGIYCFGSPGGGSEDDLVTATFKNNIIKDSGWGIVAEDNCQLTILNNLIYNNKNSVNTDGAGVLVKNNYSYNITSEIRNNTIDGNYHGIWSENSNSKVINNIVSSNVGGRGVIDSTGIYHIGTGASDNTYNDVWGNGDEYSGDATAENGSINADPRFVGVPGRDYRLKTGSVDFSPCLDAGHPDFSYNDRIYSTNTTRNDLGAYGGPDNNWETD